MQQKSLLKRRLVCTLIFTFKQKGEGDGSKVWKEKYSRKTFVVIIISTSYLFLFRYHLSIPPDQACDRWEIGQLLFLTGTQWNPVATVEKAPQHQFMHCMSLWCNHISTFYSIRCLHARKHAESAQYKNAQSICIFLTVLRCVRHPWYSLSVWLYTTSPSADGNFNGNACNKMNFFHRLLGKS